MALLNVQGSTCGKEKFLIMLRQPFCIVLNLVCLPFDILLQCESGVEG